MRLDITIVYGVAREIYRPSNWAEPNVNRLSTTFDVPAQAQCAASAACGSFINRHCSHVWGRASYIDKAVSSAHRMTDP